MPIMDEERRAVGVVLPSNNTVLDAELAVMLPSWLTRSVSRIEATGADAEALLSMSAAACRAADELVASGVGLILYGCLSTSLARGISWDQEFSAAIEARTGRPCVTAADATVRAIRRVGASRIGLVTPYPEDIDRLLPPFLADRGIEVAAHASLRISDIDEVGRREPSEVSELGRSLDGAFDALVVLATDLRTVAVIEELERDLGIPVVTTNQALARSVLDTLAGGAAVFGYGSLLSGGSLADASGRC